MKEKILIFVLIMFATITGHYLYNKFITQNQNPSVATQRKGFNKRALLIFTQLGSLPCKRFRHDANNNASVRKALLEYLVTYVPTAKNRWGIQVEYYPTFVIVDNSLTAEGTGDVVIKRLEGYQNAADFVKWLKDD